MSALSSLHDKKSNLIVSNVKKVAICSAELTLKDLAHNLLQLMASFFQPRSFYEAFHAENAKGFYPD
jgi:hypothetical protein